MTEDPLYDFERARIYLNISGRSLKHYIRDGRISFVNYTRDRYRGEHFKFKKSVLDSFIAAHTQENAHE